MARGKKTLELIRWFLLSTDTTYIIERGLIIAAQRTHLQHGLCVLRQCFVLVATIFRRCELHQLHLERAPLATAEGYDEDGPP